jgi:putative transposase
MPRNARCVLPDIAYHVTQRGTDRQRVFFLNSDREMYLRLLSRNLAGSKARVLAYALMTNHIHVIVIPERPDSLAILFRRVHGRYAQYINTRRGRSGHLWQGRFYSCPLDGAHLATALG